MQLIVESPTAESPLLVTDSWRRANTNLAVTDVPTPPSQESSSDSVFTDPGEIILAGMVAEAEARNQRIYNENQLKPTCIIERTDKTCKCKTPSLVPSHFTVSRHRKIELSPASPPPGELTTCIAGRTSAHYSHFGLNRNRLQVLLNVGSRGSVTFGWGNVGIACMERRVHQGRLSSLKEKLKNLINEFT